MIQTILYSLKSGLSYANGIDPRFLWYVIGMLVSWGIHLFLKEKPNLKPAYDKGFTHGVEIGMKTAAGLVGNFGETVVQDIYNRPIGDVRIGPVPFSGKHAADAIYRHIERKDFDTMDEFI